MGIPKKLLDSTVDGIGPTFSGVLFCDVGTKIGEACTFLGLITEQHSLSVSELKPSSEEKIFDADLLCLFSC